MNKYFNAALALLLTFSSVAFSQFRDRDRPPRFPENPPRNDEQSVVQSLWVNHWVINDSVDLSHVIRNNYGRELAQVEVQVDHDLRGSTIDLIVNGRSVDHDDPSGSGSILRPGRQAILGNEIRSLSIRVNGSVFINEVKLYINGNRYNPPQPPRPPSPPPYYGNRIERQINVDLRGNDKLDLGQSIGLSQYRGERVSAVVVEMESLYRGGVSTAELLVNSFSQGRVNVSNRRESIFNITGSNTIGRGFDSLVLYTQGDLRVRRVVLILE